jgi:hypothetical protein
MTASIVMLLLLAHLFGDYVFQNHWMANEKTRRWFPALVHGAVYTACHVPVTRSLAALAVICGTHVVIDHWRLPKHLIAFRDSFPSSYPRPDYTTGLAFALLILADNAIHLAINAASVAWLDA